MSNPFRQFRCKPHSSVSNKVWSDSKFINDNDYKQSTSCLENLNTQFDDIKMINETQHNITWPAADFKPGINVNAPHYVPKRQMYKFPERQNFTRHESNSQIVPYHHYNNNNYSISANNNHQQPLIYNYNNFSTNQEPNTSLSYNKFENISYNPVSSNNKKMLNTESNEFTLSATSTKNHQQMQPAKFNDNASNKYSLKIDKSFNDGTNDVHLQNSTSNPLQMFKFRDDDYFDQYALKNSDNLSIDDNVQASKHYEFTAEQLRELNEEPLNTENAMVAVMGYNPKDDKRICKFYNSKTNDCFKGAHCKYEHVEINKGIFIL